MCTSHWIDFRKPIPIYSEIDFTDKCPQVFNLPRASQRCLTCTVRCASLQIIPHAHGTHLEGRSHVDLSVENARPALNLNGPLITTIIDYERPVDTWFKDTVQFLIIKKRTPKLVGFRGINPEFMKHILMEYPNISVLGINEPSFDPEQDEGRLLAHKVAFSSPDVHLVEFLDLNNSKAKSGLMFHCFLNLYRFGVSDAYPCSPVLYEIPAKIMLNDSCLFCKIIRGVIPSFKVYETAHSFAFLDINPLSKGHILIIPKFHGAQLHEIPDEYLSDHLPVARKIILEGLCSAGSSPIPAYNVLQNNGRLAHQEVDHVHFHLIPKRSESDGLGIRWPSTEGNMTELSQFAEEIRARLSKSAI